MRFLYVYSFLFLHGYTVRSSFTDETKSCLCSQFFVCLCCLDLCHVSKVVFVLYVSYMYILSIFYMDIPFVPTGGNIHMYCHRRSNSGSCVIFSGQTKHKAPLTRWWTTIQTLFFTKLVFVLLVLVEQHCFVCGGGKNMRLSILICKHFGINNQNNKSETQRQVR